MIEATVRAMSAHVKDSQISGALDNVVPHSLGRFGTVSPVKKKSGFLRLRPS